MTSVKRISRSSSKQYKKSDKIYKIFYHPSETGFTPIKYIFQILVLLVMGCHGPVQEELVLLDFETDNELDKVHWKCHTLFSLSDENVTHGKHSLKLELFPDEYPGISPWIEKKDWQAYESLNLDIYNPEEREMKIVIRIDDREDSPDYADRYNHSFILAPGLNRMDIPLNTLVTSGTKRNLDLKNIQAVAIFMVNPSEKHTVFIDYVRLEGWKAGRLGGREADLVLLGLTKFEGERLLGFIVLFGLKV